MERWCCRKLVTPLISRRKRLLFRAEMVGSARKSAEVCCRVDADVLPVKNRREISQSSVGEGNVRSTSSAPWKGWLRMHLTVKNVLFRNFRRLSRRSHTYLKRVLVGEMIWKPVRRNISFRVSRARKWNFPGDWLTFLIHFDLFFSPPFGLRLVS